MTAGRTWLLAGAAVFGLAFLAFGFIAWTTGRYEAVLYGAFPLALAVVLFVLARKEQP
jgi:hypothetical protein